MPVITIFHGAFCNETPIIQAVLKQTGYRLVTDSEIAAKAAKTSRLSEERINHAFSATPSVFNSFTHERERAIAHLRLAVAEMLSEDKLLIQGFSSHLIPKQVSHVLRICLIADMPYRSKLAAEEKGISEKEAVQTIRKEDEKPLAWVNTLFKIRDPWDASLYDIIIPTDKMSKAQVVSLIDENLSSNVIKPTSTSKKAAEDFVLAATVERVLAREGHNVSVSARDGAVTLTINKNVLMLNRLEQELKGIVEKIPGVMGVETRVGKGFYQTDIYRKYDFEMPSKVLLVDDEREFVQTLSERLRMRDMGSAVAYDGESALHMVNEDEPEVMILDLKMPGIDGIDVLRKVKATRPEIEVIILTGHGSESDRETCMALGAFAYLQKPVDIELLSKTLKEANERVQRKKGNRS